MIGFELRSAWRGLRMRPAFSALVVGVLAVGLGCVLFVGGMINGLMIEPFPFPQPDRLFDAGMIDNDDPPDASRFNLIDAPTLLEWREHVGASAQLAAVGQRTINLSDGERPERFDGAAVSANFFEVLGVRPVLGRGFALEDERPGAETVVIVSDRVWRERFLADPRIIGREVRVNARPARVVGVMPPGFSYPYREAVWIPATLARDAADEEFRVVLRTADGVAPAAVQAALDGWFAMALQRDPVRMRSEARAVGVQSLTRVFVDPQTRSIFWTMAAAVILVLAIACANATNLLLTQIATRQQELWLRGALGASRTRLVLHLLTQSLMLSGIALLLALPLAQFLIDATLHAFDSAGDGGPPGWMNFDLDARMLGFAAAAALATALATALLPALRAGAPAEHATGGRVQSGRGFARISRILVIGEVALSCALLIAAVVMMQAVIRLNQFDLGFDTSRLLTARIALFDRGYPDVSAVQTYMRRLGERLRAEPGVEAVTFSSSLPGLMGENIDVLERGMPRPATGLDDVGYSAVDEHFSPTLGLGLIEGRMLQSGDFEPEAATILVDENFARRYRRDGSIVGRSFLLEGGRTGPREATVVGVVRSIQMDDIDDPIEPSVLEPMRHPPRYFSVLVRTRGAPADQIDALMGAVADVDPDTPAYWVRGYDAVLNEAMIGVRMLGRIFSGFGMVALALASAGLYGVVAFAVAQRTREIGLRRALGSPDARVLGSVAGRSLWQIGIGLALGLGLGIPFAQLLATPLAHVVAVEAPALVAVVAVLALVALLAVWIPARRALRVDPMTALRHD
jgi:putative ABC transport system permease protein